MNDNIIKIALNYYVGDKSLYDPKCDDFKSLFLSYLSDKNSSTLREGLSLEIAGYKKLNKKHGPDGKHIFTNKLVEVKPTFAYFNEEKNKQQKLRGSGNFNDITYKKIHLKKDWNVISSGFSEHSILYTVEFPFSQIEKDLTEYVDKKVIKNKKVKKGKQQGRFTAPMSYLNWIDASDLYIHHIDLKNLDDFLVKNFAKLLKRRHNEQLSRQVP